MQKTLKVRITDKDFLKELSVEDIEKYLTSNAWNKAENEENKYTKDGISIILPPKLQSKEESEINNYVLKMSNLLYSISVVDQVSELDIISKKEGYSAYAIEAEDIFNLEKFIEFTDKSKVIGDLTELINTCENVYEVFEWITSAFLIAGDIQPHPADKLICLVLIVFRDVIQNDESLREMYESVVANTLLPNACEVAAHLIRRADARKNAIEQNETKEEVADTIDQVQI